jgi:hypothetical protein
MTMNKRHNAIWKYSEVDSLYRNYELLELTPEQIAEKHQRTVYAILYRLKKEGLIDKEARNGWSFDFDGWQKSKVYEPKYNFSEVDDEDSDIDDNDDSSDYSDSSDYHDNYEDSDLDSEADYESEHENYNNSYLKKIESENEKFKVEMNGRILMLEESMFDMKTMVASLLKKFTSSSSRAPLRSCI